MHRFLERLLQHSTSVESSSLHDPLRQLLLLRSLFAMDPKVRLLAFLSAERGSELAFDARMVEALDEALQFDVAAEVVRLHSGGAFGAATAGGEVFARQQARGASLGDAIQRRIVPWLRRWRYLETKAASLEFAEPLRSNLRSLGRHLRLDETELLLLGYAVLLHTDRLLRFVGWRTSLHIEDYGRDFLINAFSGILDRPASAIRRAIGAEGRLAQCGLLTVVVDDVTMDRRREEFQATAVLRFPLPDFAWRMRQPMADATELLRAHLLPCPAATLQVSDFPHLQDGIGRLCAVLQRAQRSPRAGLNFLLHGPSGTGKTELVRTLAAHLGLGLSEVVHANEAGAPLAIGERLRCCRLAQFMMNATGQVLLFDEVEGVLDEGVQRASLFQAESSGAPNKLWIHRLLEQNETPCFWIANGIERFDPAFLRRFTLILHVPTLPLRQRERLVARLADGRIGPALTARIAAARHATPALIAHAVKLATDTAADAPADEFEHAVESTLNSTLRAQGVPALEVPPSGAAFFDSESLHTDPPVGAFVESLRDVREARLCFHGPSGTGKTETARHLAAACGRALVHLRASDVLSCLVGQTERAIAEAFGGIDPDTEALLIDEIDGLLHERADAFHSWEVTRVNELLASLERFRGLLFVTTNRMDALDAAALRRFDLKVAFHPLKPQQIWRLLRLHLERASLPAPQEALRRSIEPLTLATPGDFAVLARRHRFAPMPDAVAWVEALAAECALKRRQGRGAIGFHAQASALTGGSQ